MKKAIVIAALAAALCLLSGCDFFRVLAGRPTSREIVAKRVRIGQELAAGRRPADAPAEIPADTLAGETVLPAADSAETVLPEPEVVPAAPTPTPAPAAAQTAPAGSAAKTLSARNLMAAGGSALPHRYYLMIGAFGQPANAERQAGRAEKAGYPATLIPFRNGMTAVGVSPCDDLNAAWAALEKLRGEPFCPKDVWILNND